jgi:transcription elongation GreA/GreB family factor
MQREVVSSARAAMQDAQESAMDYDEGSEDTLMDSYREEMQSKRDLFAKQLELALDDQNVVNQIDPEAKMDSAQFGAIVITEQQKLFISISLGNITLDGNKLFAVSASAPIYKAMAGKKAGETFTFRDQKIKVLEIY